MPSDARAHDIAAAEEMAKALTLVRHVHTGEVSPHRLEC